MGQTTMDAFHEDQSGLDDFEGGDGCGHPDARVLDQPSPRHLPDNDPWAGLRAVYCGDCRTVVDRVAP